MLIRRDKSSYVHPDDPDALPIPVSAVCDLVVGFNYRFDSGLDVWLFQII